MGERALISGVLTMDCDVNIIIYDSEYEDDYTIWGRDYRLTYEMKFSFELFRDEVYKNFEFHDVKLIASFT